MIKHLRITLQELSFILVALILIAFMVMSVNGSSEPKYELLLEVEVNEGDTLWSIASHYAEGVSTQSFLSILRSHNNLDQDLIYPGQKLLVPQLDTKKVVNYEGDNLLSSKH